MKSNTTSNKKVIFSTLRKNGNMFQKLWNDAEFHIVPPDFTVTKEESTLDNLYHNIYDKLDYKTDDNLWLIYFTENSIGVNDLPINDIFIEINNVIENEKNYTLYFNMCKSVGHSETHINVLITVNDNQFTKQFIKTQYSGISPPKQIINPPDLIPYFKSIQDDIKYLSIDYSDYTITCFINLNC